MKVGAKGDDVGFVVDVISHVRGILAHAIDVEPVALFGRNYMALVSAHVEASQAAARPRLEWANDSSAGLAAGRVAGGGDLHFGGILSWGNRQSANEGTTGYGS